MKKLTLLLLLALAFASASQAYTSRLILSLPAHDAYSVFVNGSDYGLENGRLLLADLQPGSYHITVMKHVPDAHRPGFLRSYRVAVGRVDIGASQYVEGFLNHRGGVVFKRRQLHVAEIAPMHTEAFAFAALLERLEDASFDRTRLDIARQAVALRGMSSQQIAAIARSFAFDSYRLDFLQFAYRYCFDPEHYFMAAETLNFNSNVRRLYASIAG